MSFFFFLICVNQVFPEFVCHNILSYFVYTDLNFAMLRKNKISCSNIRGFSFAIRKNFSRFKSLANQMGIFGDFVFVSRIGAAKRLLFRNFSLKKSSGKILVFGCFRLLFSNNSPN